MKKFKIIIRSVVVHASIFALISVPITTTVVAQDGFDQAAQVGIGLIQSIGGQVMQAKQQQLAMGQQAAMMQGISFKLFGLVSPTLRYSPFSKNLLRDLWTLSGISVISSRKTILFLEFVNIPSLSWLAPVNAPFI